MTRRGPGRLPLLIVCTILLVGGAVIVLSLRDTEERRGSELAYAPRAYIHGATAEEWTARYWQWTLGFPISSTPGFNVTGDECTVGQSGNVFFIPRNMPPCTILEGVSVLVPVGAAECSTRDPFPFSGESDEQLQTCAAQEAERYTNIALTVDGERLPAIRQYRTATSPFGVILPEDNILAAPEGAAWVAADGYSVILKPLPVGEHVIIVHTELADGTVLPDERVVLTVVEPSWEPVAAPSPAVATPIIE